MKRTYEIARITDLLQVPADKREACMRELLYALDLLDLAGEDVRAGLQAIRWTDDDETNVTLEVNGEELLRLEVTKGDSKC